MLSDMKTILSIQSQVSFGAVGNTLATMVAHLMDVDIATVNTISLVAHPGYGIRAGGAASDADFSSILTAISSLDLCVLSGSLITNKCLAWPDSRMPFCHATLLFNEANPSQ